MGAALFSLLSCPQKWGMGIVSGDVRESLAEKVESKWLKGGFLT